MNRTSVRVIKQHKRFPRRTAKVERAAGPNNWSKSVRSWVAEFQDKDRGESLPAFDSLFKDAQPGRTD